MKKSFYESWEEMGTLPSEFQTGGFTVVSFRR
jgi:hypothetical protein